MPRNECEHCGKSGADLDLKWRHVGGGKEITLCRLCWEGLYPAEAWPEPERKRRYHKNRGKWEDIPFNRRLTFSEAAEIIGIARRSLEMAYGLQNPPRQLPPGFRVEREPGSRTKFLVREKV